MIRDPSGRRACLRRLALAAGAAGAACALPAAAITLAKVRERGALVVGVYNDMPPFHAAGKGIDVDLAGALAASLGLKLSLLPFNADENMNDDLRNLVWKGHYLGFGPADVLMHVPVDRPLMDATPQATIFAPYYRERVVLARNLAQLPTLETLQPLAGQRVAVPGQSLAGWLLLGADGGAYRNQLSTQWKDGTECARALQRGEVTVAAGLASELESVLLGDARFAIEPLPSPRAPRNGWATGLAVKSDATDLAQALQTSMNQLAQQGRLKDIFARYNVAWRAP
ncbi:MAG TPA: transporter substrate-binding domain-containing protein [Burkholderiaceae bacterium]|nr:transporter substrate-binding domain-containing protein [Burkholderiaceae bacterium]